MRNGERGMQNKKPGAFPPGLPAQSLHIAFSTTNGVTAQAELSVAHELSGLGSTRVVRFSASVRRRINEPDNMATGPQDGEVL